VQGRRDVVGREFGEAVGAGRAGQAVGGDRARGQPVADPGSGRVPRPEGGGRALGDDQPGGDDRHPVGQELRFLHVVGGEQHRLAERGEVFDHVPGFAPGGRVESGGRLVQEEQFGVADQGDRDIEAPLQAAGELEHPVVAPVVEADQVDHLVHRPGVRVVTGVHPDRLGHGEVEVNPGGLQDDADPALQPGPVAARILAQDADLAAVPGAVPLENLDGGGLARPVRAE